MLSGLLFIAAMAGKALAAQQDFVMWPWMNPDSMSASLDVDSTCLNAINASVSCPQGYLTSAAHYYLYSWSNDNLTTLCTQACANSLNSWEQNVIQQCSGQNVLMDGHLMKAETLVHMYKNGHDLACLQSDSGSWCMIEKEQWQGQEPAQYDDDYCIYNDPDLDMPECSDPDFDLSVAPPGANSMTKLYSTDLLCSDCFLKYFHGRLGSPFLSQGADTDYLVNEWTDIQSACGKTMPATTVTNSLYVGYATAEPTIIAARRRKAKREVTSNADIPGYAHLGCYTDANNRTLPDSNPGVDGLTLAKCQSACSGQGFGVFGVENGNECWCSNGIKNAGAPQAASNCATPCNGDSSELCGGGWALDVYSTTTAAPTATPTPTIGAVAGYKYVGCYTDADDRTLADSSTTQAGKLTLESCAQFCAGSAFFGVEYGQECYCGSKLNSNATTSTGCDHACDGNPSARCGGGWNLDVYSKTAAATTTSGTSSPPASTPGAVYGWTYQGCYTDADTRTLQGISMDHPNMTLTQCSMLCANEGEDYFGVEYGTQCYCGSAIENGALPTAECNVPCGAKPSERCGGGWALDIFKSNRAIAASSVAAATPTISAPPPAQTTCAGQLVDTADANGVPYGCQGMAQMYHVASGDAQDATGDALCDVVTQVCLPAPCTTAYLLTTDTCNNTISSLAGNNVTLVEFQTWNPHMIGTCDQLIANQYLCITPHGGFVDMPSPVYNPTGASGAYYTTATPPGPTPTGTTAKCGLYVETKTGDTCQTIALRYAISLDDFLTLNPELYSNCTNLWLDYSYCVYPIAPAPVSTDGSCGSAHNNALCPGSGFGDCCSNAGKCGSGDDFCAPQNCQAGKCQSGALTPDGSCGPQHNYYVCAPGDCCSIYGYCGSGHDFCGAGNCASGDCDPDVGGISTDGSCGPLFAGDKTCTGSQFGTCCSQYGYCGSGDDFCKGANCYSGACHS